MGTFGDASIFSTDHTKPINTICGGILYTENTELINFLKERKKTYPNLKLKNKNYLWIQFLFERNFCNPEDNGKIQLASLIFRYLIRYFHQRNNDLLIDNLSKPKERKTYPARLPTFCALLGLIEIDRWGKISKRRIKYLNQFIKIANSIKIKLPECYFDKRFEIIPLRLIWFDKNRSNLFEKFSKFLDIDSIWFKKPLIGTNESLKNFSYITKSCPKSEIINQIIVNLPCSIKPKFFKIMLDYIINGSKRR